MSRNKQCHLCDATCLQCTGPEREDCTICPSTRFFDDGRCEIRCQKGRFAMERQCHLCHHTCQECIDEGPDSCTSCDRDKFGVSRYLFQGQCRDVCPKGFFHSSRKRCEACFEDCIICTAADHCLYCSPGHRLRKGRCVPLDRSAEDSEDQVQKTVYHKCEDGYYKLGTDCYQSCPDRTYSVASTMVCVPCEEKNCVNCDKSQCYSCEDGFYTFDGKCVDQCREGFFVDVESQECKPCHRACKTCGGPQHDDCDSCEDGFMLKNSKCLESKHPCTEKHFRNKLGDCELCHFSCRTCSDSGKDNCDSCFSGHFLTAQQTCMSHCPSGTFTNKASGKCDQCSRGCLMCKDAQHCQRCHNGLYLYNGKCVEECQRGFPQGGVCQPCAPECASCQGESSHCLSCETKYLLQDHSCLSHCPAGYYAKGTECHHCPAHCKECNQDGLCTKCNQYYFLHEGNCVDDCPDGYFANEEYQDCVCCHAACALCDGPGIDDCTACSNITAVHYNGECLPQCPTSTYYDQTTKECRDCDKSCLTCSGHEPSSCLSCDTNRHKDASGHCVWFSDCSLHSYMDEKGECQECHKLCHRCSGPGKDHCLSCNEPYFLLNNTCVLKCPLDYYPEDKDERVCERCHFSCQSCAGHHSVQCVTCKPGYFKQGSSCVEFCSESHFGNTSTMVCDRCDPSCNQCSGRSNRNCLSCHENYVYMKYWGQCLKNCPQGYYQNSLFKTCHKCHPTCKTCSDDGATACKSCYEGYRFMGGICNSQCLVGLYAVSQGSDSKSDELICKACDPSCLDCHGPSMWNCTVCPALQILSDDGRCLSCCGNETRHDDKPIPRECCDCKASREECVMGVNFVMISAEDLEAKPAKVFVTICVFIILSVGGGIFLFLNARSKSRTIAPKTRAGGYERLDTNGEIASKPRTSSFGEYIDRIIECDDDEENNDDDIVYMAQDGTVYRRFKYGFLDDDEIELEYDDESYSYR